MGTGLDPGESNHSLGGELDHLRVTEDLLPC